MGFFVFILIVGIIIYLVVKSKQKSDSANRIWQNENQEKILKNIMQGRSCSNCGNHTKNCDVPGMPNPCGLWQER